MNISLTKEVLLIEDNRGDAGLIQQMLTGAPIISLQLRWVDTLSKGLSALDHHPVDAILLDLNLPDSSGLQTFQQVHSAAPHVPIVVLTGFDDDKIAAQALRAGAEDYLVKGNIDDRLLQRAIRYAIERKQFKLELQVAQQQQQAIFEAMPDFLFRFNRHGDCLDVRGPVGKLWLPFHQWIGQPLEQLVPSELAAVIQKNINRVFLKNRAVTDEFKFSFNGKVRHLEGRFVICGSDEVLAIVRDVTRSKKMQRTLAENKERYQQLVELSPDGVGVCLDGREIIYINPAGANLLGATNSSELIGRDIFDFIHGDYTTAAEAYRQTFMRKRATSQKFEMKLVRLDGRVIEVEAIGVSTVYNSQPAVQLVMRNVTERKESERLLRENEEKFRQLAEYLPNQVFWIRGVKGRMIYVSPDYEKIFGRPFDEDQPDTLFFTEPAHPVDSRLIRSLADIRNQIRHGVNHKYRIIRPDGTTRWIWTRANPVKNGAGEIYRIVGISADITEQQQSEDQLRILAQGFANQMQLLHSILNTIGDGVIVVDKSEKFIVFNPAAEEILGAGPAKATLENWSEIYGMYYDDGQTLVPASELPVVAAMRGYHIDQKEYVIKNQQQTRDVYISATSRPLLDEGGELNGGVLVFRDITTRKQVEQSLRISEKRLRSVIENMPVLMTAFDQKGRLIVWNRECERVTGYEAAAILGNSDLAQQLLIDQGESRSLLEKWQEKGNNYRNWELDITCKDGAVKTIAWSNISEEIPIPGWTSWGIGIDVTARRQAEDALKHERESLAERVKQRTAELEAANAQLARASRLKDEFLANMSHELRTPLNAILGSAEILVDETFGPIIEQQKIYVDLIRESGRHLLELINDILDLSQIEAEKLELNRTTVEVQYICDISLQFIRQALEQKQQQLTTQFDLNVSTIQADERRLKQILVNLLVNAVKFTPEGGRIGLEVVGYKTEGRIEFTVWDTGIGIAAHDLPHLFNPFEQLDGKLSRHQEGTGLGLALVLRLVQLHGGEITVESQLDEGSRFVVSLPWHQK
ncbi:MAG: PAS domain S-box protein [Anaerolineae bacterium]|nr:PAS domain S-box protein [Anaerolineae bacterium]MCB0180112.1 PAS domain S-box protein [Anaerolineae bacterium]MCB9103934.1 PAS domain S-box protein [Anaerolineales bacterium]